jgi:hypothetical protein
MNRSYSKIRHIQEANNRLEKRLLSEMKEHKRDLELQKKLDDIFFGRDDANLFSDPGEFGYLSQEHRLDKKISPKQRIERAEQVIEDLKKYISRLQDLIDSEESYIKNPEYDDIWKDVENN